MKMNRNSKRKLRCTFSLLLALLMLTPLFTGVVSAETASPSEPAKIVINTIAALNVQSIDDRESVVLARRLYDKLPDADKALVGNAGAGSGLKALETAEAKVLNYWIEDLYTGNPEVPVDHARSLGLWVLEEQYGGMNEEQQKLVTNYPKLEAMSTYSGEVIAAKIKEDYDVAKVVQDKISAMDPSSEADVKAARAVYDALTANQKSNVTNYEMLKKAEGTNDAIPSNIKFAGTRCTSYGTNLSLDNWQKINDTVQGYFPNTQPTYIWITGMLGEDKGPAGSCRIDRNFDDIKDANGKYMGKAEAEWLNENIFFRKAEPGQLEQEVYFDYFDEHGIYVYLQVESAFADMKTLMDVYYDVFNVKDHKCVKGFAVDVEWYWGVETDAGIPVTDKKAKEWNEYLYKTWGPGMQLVLKHYACTWMPTTYRGGNGSGEKLIFCDDSQSFGSLNGEAGGVYDDSSVCNGGVMGFAREFKLFADFFQNNDVIFQIGYQPDRQWFYAFDDPIIKSFSVKLAEASNPNQNIGIAWVNFSFKDPLTFPWVMTPAEAANAVNGLLSYLTSKGSNNLIGRRFDGDRTVANGGGGPTLSDTVFIKRMRDLVNSLAPEQKALLAPERIARLEVLEPMAVDVRVEHLPGIDNLGMKDYNKVKAIYDTYMMLTDAQKSKVAYAKQLNDYMKLLNALNTWESSIAGVKPVIGLNGQELDSAGFADIIPGLSDLLAANNLTIAGVSFNTTLAAKTGNEKMVGSLTGSIPNTVVLGGAADFSIDIINKMTGKVIGSADTFSKPVERIISMPKDMQSMPEKWGAFLFNEAEKKFDFVPAKAQMKDGAWIVTINSRANGNYIVAQNDAVLADIGASFWGKPYIEKAVSKGLMSCAGKNTFEPDKVVTRVEFVHMISSAIQLSDAELAGLQAVFGEAGFKPAEPVKREEMAGVLAKAVRYINASAAPKGSDLSGKFKDYDKISASLTNDIGLIYDLGIMQGTSPSTFKPQGLVTKAQAAAVAIKLLEKLGLID